jgi:hypothetical protein
MLLSLPFSVIHETDRNRHPGDLAGQPFRERKRRAAVKRVHDGVEINVPDFRRNAARGIGDSWWRISPSCLSAKRTVISMPGRACSSSGGTQQPRSAAYMARTVSSACGGLGVAGSGVAGLSAAL